MEQILLKLFEGVAPKFEAPQIIRLVLIICITVIAYIAIAVVSKRLKARLSDYGDLKRRHVLITGIRVLKVAIAVFASVAALSAFGVNLPGIATAAGILFLVFVLAFKDSLQDIFAGIVILSDKYFNVGDAVEFEDREGIVVSFTVRTTKIECLDDHSILSVANRNITKIRKLTHLTDVDLPLPYEMRQKDAFELLQSICGEIMKLDGVESCEMKGTQNFGENGVIYKIRFFCEPANRPDIRRAVLKTVRDGLEKADVQIPYAQIDVHSR